MRADAAVDLFLDMLASERGAAANTLDAYRRDLDDYTEFLAGEGLSPLNADAGAVRRWIADLHERGLKASSAARRLSAARQLHKFLYSEGERSDDPTIAIDGPAAAGKGTIGRALADRFGFAHLDTGLLYRGGPITRLTAGRTCFVRSSPGICSKTEDTRLLSGCVSTVISMPL